jgi:3-hydroxymyristoyl/3-hydroxydecanoyl-(acyl carrier protein) dehydratase
LLIKRTKEIFSSFKKFILGGRKRGHVVISVWYSLTEIVMQKDEMAARVTTDSNSPWFSGHFPDDPILPGIAQLKMVADLIAISRKDASYMTGLSRIKFRKIVRPGEPLDIHATHGKIQNQYAFRISSSDKEICSGMMFFASKSDKPIKTEN